MRSFIIAPLFALALSGCASGLNPQSVGTAVNNINATVAEVQTIAKEVCSFVPAAVTVSNIISKFVPGLSTAQQIAQSICNAVAPANVTAARRARTVPVVAGVPIKGRFVR
jgi:hypothetical protein